MFSALHLVTALRTVIARIVRLFLSFFIFAILWPISSSPFNLFVRFSRAAEHGMLYHRSSLTNWSHFYFSDVPLIYDAQNWPPPKLIKFLFLSFRNVFINSLLCVRSGGRKEEKYPHIINRKKKFLQLIACTGLMINVSGDATVYWRMKE